MSSGGEKEVVSLLIHQQIIFEIQFDWHRFSNKSIEVFQAQKVVDIKYDNSENFQFVFLELPISDHLAQKVSNHATFRCNAVEIVTVRDVRLIGEFYRWQDVN